MPLILYNIKKYVIVLYSPLNSAYTNNMSAQSTSHDLTLLTSADVAEILKMHPQVIARKLQCGELEGYKLGKEWRVSKEQLMRYLDRHSNQKAAKSPEAKTLENFFEDGRLKSIPAARGKRLHVLRHLVSKLDVSRVYTETEINEFLRPFHSDICTLRREFIINKLMVRSGGKYKVVGWNQ
jgi:excisionase family DNA binding protein